MIFSLAFINLVYSQSVGSFKSNFNPSISLHNCDSSGVCAETGAQITLDANWRWIHKIDSYDECFGNDNQWKCGDESQCTMRCVLEGVDRNDWKNSYGVEVSGEKVELNLVANGNVGSRLYVLEDGQYKLFKLKNREFSFDVDVSNLPCGVNGALYFVEMQADGGKSRNPFNKAGAEYGTGYCDAQCPKDLKWINGMANSRNWVQGKGNFGSCCAEIDIWEANAKATSFTAHPCSTTSQFRCEGISCGQNDNRNSSVCDKDGCDFNPYRLGSHKFYGLGSNFQIDSSQTMTIVTQFITHNGKDDGELVAIERKWIQNGIVHDNIAVSIDGLPEYNSITDSNCAAQKTKFGEINSFNSKGGLKSLGESLDRGMVLVLSIWDDHDSHMLWLDSEFPLTQNRKLPGISRGPCSRSSGRPEEIEKLHPNSKVSFSNLKQGPIGSAFKLLN
jgi:cellulose 1,4-beta-cellobiosidase